MARDPVRLELGPWLPDLPDLDNPGVLNARGVLPRTPKSYGPIGSLTPYSSALTARCQGAAAFLDQSNNVHLFAGDATKLYHLVSGSTNWTDVSKVGGYGCPSDGQWNFEYYGGIVVATDLGDAIQAFTLASSVAFADLSAGAPKAKFCAFIKNFLMVANTIDGVGGNQTQRAWWSAAGNPANWPVPGSVAAAQAQSSFNDLYGKHGAAMGLVGNLGGADGAVFMERAVFRVVYAGPPNVFDFPPAEGVQGCPASNSIVQFGNRVFYLGQDGFYAFDGVSSQPIGAMKVDKTFFGDLDQSHMDRVVGSVDPLNKMIFWAYPGAGNLNGNPNHILVWNWFLDRWSILDVTVETVCRMLTIGYTLDQLFTVLGYTLDNLPAPLDSRVWSGGATILGAFDTAHKLNYFTGANLAVTLDTMERQPFPGRVATIVDTRPLVDGGKPSVAIGSRSRLVDPSVFGAARAMTALGNCPLRTTGRYLRARITMPAGQSFTHLQGVELEGRSAGRR